MECLLSSYHTGSAYQFFKEQNLSSHFRASKISRMSTSLYNEKWVKKVKLPILVHFSAFVKRYKKEQIEKHRLSVNQFRRELENVERIATSVTINDLITQVLRDQSSDPLVTKPKDGNPFDKSNILSCCLTWC